MAYDKYKAVRCPRMSHRLICYRLMIPLIRAFYITVSFADNKMLNSSFSIIVQADTIQLHLLLPMAYEDIYLLLGLILLQVLIETSYTPGI